MDRHELQGYTLASRNTVMYPHLNAAGRLFGGQLMSWIDEGTAIVARQIMGTRNIVTRKFGEIVFDAPGLLGDVVEIWCRPEKLGRTSLTMDCRVVVQRGAVAAAELEAIGRSSVVYVALDEAGRPFPWRRDAAPE
jgi:acyl-CoA hydrolase